MVRPAMARRLSSQKPNSLMVSVCRQTEKSLRSAAISEPSITAPEAPKSSWILTPSAPPATDSSTAPGSEQPRPRKPKFSGLRSSDWISCPSTLGPEQLTSKCGPGDMPIIVVVPPASACSHCCGDRKCACASTAPAVIR